MLRDIEVIVPPLELQTRFAGAVASLEKLHDQQVASSVLLEEVGTSLQQSAFAGAL